jgi:hypothetical protein
VKEGRDEGRNEGREGEKREGFVCVRRQNRRRERERGREKERDLESKLAIQLDFVECGCERMSFGGDDAVKVDAEGFGCC